MGERRLGIEEERREIRVQRVGLHMNEVLNLLRGGY